MINFLEVYVGVSEAESFARVFRGERSKVTQTFVIFIVKMVPITSFAVFVGSDKGFDSNAGPRAVNIDSIEHGFNFISPL